MKGSLLRRGAALITALVIILILSLLVGASLVYAGAHYSLGYANSREATALHLSEAGINNELQYIAQNVGASSVSGKSSQPTLQNGETMQYPSDTHACYGRRSGTTEVGSLSNSYFWVYSSNDSAGTTAWDTKTFPFYITATGYCNGAWKRVRVQAEPISIFTLNAVFALAAYTSASKAIQLNAATVTVVGTAGTNAPIASNNSTIVADNCINADTSTYSSGEFTASNLSGSGTYGIVSRSSPITYPTVTNVLSVMKGLTFTGLSTSNDDNTKIYTYADAPSSQTLSTTNCKSLNLGFTSTPTLSASNWSSANYKPNTYVTSSVVGSGITGATNATPIEITTSANHGLSTGQSVFISGVTGNTAANGNWTITKTSAKKFTLNGSKGNGTYSNATTVMTIYQNLVRTLILEPGDYFFNQVQISDTSGKTEFVLDPFAKASGGSTGQIRIWIYDPANGTQNDNIDIPISFIGSDGNVASTPDASAFRIYYSKDGKTFAFNRPSGYSNYDGSTFTGDFTVYGGVYCVTKQPNDGTALKGTGISFSGLTNVSQGLGQIVLKGSLLADQISFQGSCRIEFKYAPNTSDPEAGSGIFGGYTDGG